jgi:hypothetical protein
MIGAVRTGKQPLGHAGVVVPDLLCNGPLNMPAYLELGVIYKVQICPRATLKNSQRRGAS